MKEQEQNRPSQHKYVRSIVLMLFGYQIFAFARIVSRPRRKRRPFYLNPTESFRAAQPCAQ